MKRKLTTIFYVICIISLIAPIWGLGEDTNTETKEPGYRDYDISYYIYLEGYHPTPAVYYNWDFLKACQEGKTLKELKAEGFEVTENQLMLLKSMKLLEETQEFTKEQFEQLLKLSELKKLLEETKTYQPSFPDLEKKQHELSLKLSELKKLLEETKVYKTAFPILEPDETKKFREVSKEVSEKIGQELEPDFKTLILNLNKKRFRKNAYTILFSYILDNLVWDEFDDIEAFWKKNLEFKEKPSWNGFMWAMYPKREYSCGTNSNNSEGVTFSYGWTKPSLEKISQVVNDSAVKDLINDIQEFGEFRNKEAIKTCKRSFNICNSNARLNFPVIRQVETDEVYMMCKKFAEKVADKVEEKLDFQKIEEEFGVKGRAETIIIIYHEIMWDLLDYLEERKIIQKPKIFAQPEKAHLNDVKDVMMIIIN